MGGDEKKSTKINLKNLINGNLYDKTNAIIWMTPHLPSKVLWMKKQKSNSSSVIKRLRFRNFFRLPFVYIVSAIKSNQIHQDKNGYVIPLFYCPLNKAQRRLNYPIAFPPPKWFFFSKSPNFAWNLVFLTNIAENDHHKSHEIELLLHEITAHSIPHSSTQPHI